MFELYDYTYIELVDKELKVIGCIECGSDPNDKCECISCGIGNECPVFGKQATLYKKGVGGIE